MSNFCGRSMPDQVAFARHRPNACGELFLTSLAVLLCSGETLVVSPLAGIPELLIFLVRVLLYLNHAFAVSWHTIFISWCAGEMACLYMSRPV